MCANCSNSFNTCLHSEQLLDSVLNVSKIQWKIRQKAFLQIQFTVTTSSNAQDAGTCLKWIGPQWELLHINNSDIDKTMQIYILVIHMKYFLKENKLSRVFSNDIYLYI